MNTEAINAAAAEYGYYPSPSPLPVLFYARPSDTDADRMLMVHAILNGDAPFVDVTLGVPGVRHSDPVAALHALMALCGIGRVEVNP